MDRYRKISSDVLRQKQKRKEHLLLVDLRSPSDYKNEHVVDSVNIPWEMLKIRELAQKHPGTVIVLICSSGKLANLATGFFFDPEFPETLVLAGGLLSWRVFGHPMAR